MLYSLLFAAPCSALEMKYLFLYGKGRFLFATKLLHKYTPPNCIKHSLTNGRPYLPNQKRHMM